MMKTIDDVAGRRVLVRTDLNVPLDGDRIPDDGRIRASLPTLTALISRGARVIVCSYLGRPGGRSDLKYSLAPVAARLGRLLGQEVDFPGGIVGTGQRRDRGPASRRPGHAGKPALLRGMIGAWHAAVGQELPAIPAEVLKPLAHEFRHAVLAGLASVPRVPGAKNAVKQEPAANCSNSAGTAAATS